ncbi:MAG: GIY-YIG nuclease family protein [Sphingobacteriales bacterium]|nr:MAG: GIY-YIG nuclease family protein [Sphingobacteriales bacterium]
MNQHHYYVYIITNATHSVVYIGMTNDLPTRLAQHFDNRGIDKSFAGKYHCYKLIYFEQYEWIEHAIDREKEIKKWNRKKKVDLINSLNPNWEELNERVREL